MSLAVQQYLDRIMIYANLKDADEAAAARAEQEDHLEEKIERLKADGQPPEDAVFQAIEEHGAPRVVGYGLRPKFPWVDVRSHGTARGVIAIGPRAVGVFAFGGASMGVFAFGGLAVGVVSMGGLAVSLLFAWAGLALVPTGVAYAGAAIGLIAMGGFAAGVIAAGGFAIGLWADGGVALTHYPLESLPPVVRWVGTYMPNAKESWYLMMALMALFFPLIIVSNALQYRENKRVRDADPKLAE